MAVLGLGPCTLPGDEPREQQPLLCLIQAVVTACFVRMYMQASGFLTHRMLSECTLGADHCPQATVVVSLLSPAEAGLGNHAAGDTAKNDRDS